LEVIQLNQNLKGAAWVLLYCVTFTCSMSIHKLVNPDIPTSLKVFMRACFGLVFFSPLIIKDGLTIFKSTDYKLHLIRIFYMSLAMGGTYFTYANLPFTVATSIGFTGPIFTAVLSYFILKDRLKFGQWISIFIGYLGVLLIVNPTGDINNTVYVAIFANIVTGLNLIYARKLTAIDSRNTIVIMGNIGVIITTGIWSLLYWLLHVYGNSLASITWQLPNLNDTLLLMGMGLLGAFSQIAYITALRYASPGFLGPFEYSRLIISIPIGLALGDALPEQQQVLGILTIVVSTLYLSWKGRLNDQ
jgi:drug/metabolite transporter (DMT)-like permease